MAVAEFTERSSAATPGHRPPLHRRYSGQAGAIGGLSDTALAVVVGTLTLVGVVGFFQSSSVGARTNSEIANLVALVANIRAAYYQAGSSYSGINAAGLATTKIAPTPLIRGPNLMSMFGSAIAVAPVGASSDQFSITYSGMPADACVKVTTTTWNTLSDITATTINGATPTFDMAGATGNCTLANNAIVLTFR
jgi:hypothetical protein